MIVRATFYRVSFIAAYLAFTFMLYTQLEAQPTNVQSSVLQKGTWHKVAIEKEGVYKINYALLKKMGFDPTKVDPQKIRLFGNGGGMLPQANSATRPVDLTENALYIKGEEDNIFNSDDYILFYAQGPDKSYFDLNRGIFSYEHNLYADKNFYFLTVGDEHGKRIAVRESLTGNFPLVTEFNDYVFHEVDQHNELQSGREWVGEKFDLVKEHNLKFDIEGVKENSEIRIVSDVMGKSHAGSTFKISFNNTPIKDQYVLPISDARYALKGYDRRDTVTVNANTVSATGSTSQQINYQYVTAEGRNGTGYLDFLLINVVRALSRYGNQTIFQSATSLTNSASQFEVGNASNTTIWDITSPSGAQQQNYSMNGSSAVFSTPTTSLTKFIIFSDANIPEPQLAGAVKNQNLHDLSTPNLLIITSPALQAEAERLADHRRQHNQLAVAVVTTEEIYNEFSSGRQDVTALRDFVKYLYDKSSGGLKNLLLFGRCSYDYKDRIDKNTNLVPTYESRNSLHPLETYSSDDYYGFLENNEGTWRESPADNHTLDIGIGRLPVKTAEEAKSVVDKVIYYDTDLKTLGTWRTNIAFVADDGDFNQHQLQADNLAKIVETNYPQYNTKKIYLDGYAQIQKPNGEIIPEANEKVLESLDRGSLIINYTGHGGEKQLAQERIFDDFIIETLDNKNLPLFVTATCEFGRHDNPLQISSAELCVLRPNSGAIGIVATARPVNSTTNFELNKAFYEALWQLQDGKPLTLGEVFRRTKNNSISGVSNRNFSLLADPSLTLAFPTLEARITEIKTASNSDTLKALSHVFVKGDIVNATQQVQSSFKGTLSVTLYDKESRVTTLGNENPPFSFYQRSNTLFRGQANITNGMFEFEFIVPKNIAYQLGKGKLNVYGSDDSHFTDAAGASLNFTVGKSETSPGIDTTPPDVRLFIGDSTFLNGGVTSKTTTLVAKLSDKSGITISDYGIGNGIIAILDGVQTFNLNDYYQSQKNDFTNGWIYFPLKALTPGPHSITLKAWDTYNNPGSATVDFIVTGDNSLVIETFRNYPNPFQESTTLYFTHNHPGDDLETALSIYDITGNLLETSEKIIYASTYQVNLMELNGLQDFSKKLTKGLYLARLVVRSVTDGSKNERVTKLIIVN